MKKELTTVEIGLSDKRVESITNEVVDAVELVFLRLELPISAEIKKQISEQIKTKFKRINFSMEN